MQCKAKQMRRRGDRGGEGVLIPLRFHPHPSLANDPRPPKGRATELRIRNLTKTQQAEEGRETPKKPRLPRLLTGLTQLGNLPRNNAEVALGIQAQ
jgi:hypothetical protein